MKKIIIVLLVTLVACTTPKECCSQSNWCDSLSYSIVIDSTTWNTLTVTGNANGISNIVDSIDWNFTACNATACYIPQGNDPYSFPLIYPSDTVKLCYDAYVYWFGTITMCNHCDSLIYDFMSDTWIVYKRLNPTFVIEEEGVRWYSDKVYDLLGKELHYIPVGKTYIRNNRLYITK